MKVAREGFLPAAVAAVPAVLAHALGASLAAVLLWALPVAVLAFFRDPHRRIPSEPGLVVAPADGRVVAIVPAGEDGGGAGDRVRLSIFLSLFNVHINRSPVEAEVRDVRYHAGEFLPAFRDKASRRNERNEIDLWGEGLQFGMVQIAGLVARRIVCRVRRGDRLARGERVGLIQFGSRVDLLLPRTVQLRVRVGDRVRGGSSVVGSFPPTGGGV